jgi:hypothetical protein
MLDIAPTQIDLRAMSVMGNELDRVTLTKK